MRNLFHSGTTILVFLRHFACIACRGHVREVMSHKEKYDQAGAKIIFIGNGQSKMIQYFKEDMGIQSSEVYTDPSLETFKACGFREGFLSLVNLTSVQHVAALFIKGDRQKPYVKDMGVHQQMGGVVVIKPGEKVAYHYISEGVGDIPESESVIQESSESNS